MRPFFLAFAAAELALAPAAATAQTSEQDVKCMLVSNVFATKEADPKRRQVALLSVAFYLGRIDAKLSPAQFRAMILTVGKEPMDKNVGLVMTNCARGLQAKQGSTAQILQQIGQQQAQLAKAKAK